ncbi:Alpha/Beta hydrolase protein [Leptodontidium sp. MPI-SDFR-AT-0119]|nr:Alpha/Beta hydrolase protein [Leptodontidium sp. MPI-SDFR-AT-0119]
MRFSTLLAVVALACTSVHGAALTKVSNYGGKATSKAQMWVYVPDNVKPNPSLVVAIHSCESSAQKYFQNDKIPWKKGSDGKGYVTIWPSAPQSCWDVSSKSTLVRNGGGDSNAIANMIIYAMDKYKVNATQVFVTGGSSGAMMGNVMAAAYPDLMSAVSVYSGVAAGCYVGAGVAQWNNACANGQSTKTAQAWGDIARAIYPGYNGTRPRMQIWHGSADGTIAPQNYQEELKQWTNIFGVSMNATDSKDNTPEAKYKTSNYGPNVQGIYATGVGHSCPSHLAESEAWFGLVK